MFIPKRDVAFVGMRLPSIAATNLSEIEVPGETYLLKEMHITLAYLGKSVPITQVFRAMACCYAAAQEFGPFQVTTAAVMSFPADQKGIPVIARIVTPQLFSLRERIVQLFDANGVEYSKRHPQYKPHVTLSYSKQPVPIRVINPVQWDAGWITVWGGEEMDDGIFSDIQLVGQSKTTPASM
jgi:2'-5' RNA ligase